MSQILTAGRGQSAKLLIQSDSSSDFSAKNNKERMKEFKTLSLKGNTFMEHLLSSRADKPCKRQNSVLFHSQKWDFAPILEKNDKDDLTGSIKSNTDNPFHRAKQSFLEKQKVSSISGSGKKYIDEPALEFELDNEKTTFRLLKKGSLNQPLNAYLRKEL